MSSFFLFYYLFLLIDFRERERKGNINLLFHLLVFMYFLVNSCMCPDRGLNPQPWCIGMML